jgi:hypothetical protein
VAVHVWDGDLQLPDVSFPVGLVVVIGTLANAGAAITTIIAATTKATASTVRMRFTYLSPFPSADIRIARGLRVGLLTAGAGRLV